MVEMSEREGRERRLKPAEDWPEPGLQSEGGASVDVEEVGVGRPSGRPNAL